MTMQAAQHIADTSIEAGLFNRAAFAPTSYPRLQAVFQRMVTASAESLREVCSVPPQYVFEEMRAEPLGAILDELGDDGMAAIFNVPEWRSRVIFAVDREFVYALPEVLFGADGSDSSFAEKRKFSSVEKNLARATLGSAAKALQASLAPVANLSFVFDRIETSMDMAAVDDRNSAAVVATFRLRAPGRNGKLKVVIPRAAIQASRATAQANAADGAASADPNWQRQMEEGIRSTDVTLRAVLEEKRITLREVAELRVGQVMTLRAGVDTRIQLECNDEPLFLCQVGQSNGAYTLRVEEILKLPTKVAP